MRHPLLLATLATAALCACDGAGFDPDGDAQCDPALPVSIPFGLPRLSAVEPAAPLRFVVTLGEAAAEDALSSSYAPRPIPERADAIERVGGRVIRRLSPSRFSAELTAEQAATLERSPDIRHLEVDPPRYPLAVSGGQSTPWGIPASGLTEAWAAAAPLKRGARVCVIDSGLYSDHEDLFSPDPAARSGFPAEWAQDACGHGTHVAGTIAALDNGTGVVGASPLGADLFAVRVFSGDDCGWTYGSELADAVDRCVASGARVINMSLGGFSPSSLERDAMINAWRQGVVLVAAAGNSGDNELEYPAAYPVVLSVGAIDEEGKVAAFSQRNPQVDLVAPGVAVESTVPFVSRHEVQVEGATLSGAPLEHAQNTAGVTGTLINGGSCSAPGPWSGGIVVCRRGGGTFVEKVRAAKSGGAIAAVIYNNGSGEFAGTLGASAPALPALAVSSEAGARLLEHAGKIATLVNEPRRGGSGYARFSGTSMAAPHVAGVASFLFGQLPDRTGAQVRDALLKSAQDLGATGPDDEAGHGLLRADAAFAALLTNERAELTPLSGFVTSCDGLVCTFTDTGTVQEGTLASRSFDFGDGAQAEGTEQLTHAYSKGGIYEASITLTDSQGRSSTSRAKVSVVAATARTGLVRKDGARDVHLEWTGIKTGSVLVMRDGKPAGMADNSGSVVAQVQDAGGPMKFRVCSSGAESCSAELLVLPPCS